MRPNKKAVLKVQACTAGIESATTPRPTITIRGEWLNAASLSNGYLLIGICVFVAVCIDAGGGNDYEELEVVWSRAILFAAHCRFHLATQVGKYCQVGEYWPERSSREIRAEVHDPEWLGKNRHLKGDYFDSAYMTRLDLKIGCDRKYERMVFKAGKPCQSKVRPADY